MRTVPLLSAALNDNKCNKLPISDLGIEHGYIWLVPFRLLSVGVRKCDTKWKFAFYH